MIRSACTLVSLAAVLLSASALAQTPGGVSLPADIDPVSLSRLPIAKREDMHVEGQRVFDMVAGRDRASPLLGPGGISLHLPQVAESMHHLNQYLRGETAVLDPRYREVAILVTAREYDQRYEWSGHETAARNYGTPDAVIDAIRYDRDVAGLSPEEALVIRYARQVLRENKLSSELWAQAVERFGQQGAFEIAAVIGDYAMAAIMLNAVDQHLPPGREAMLPVR